MKLFALTSLAASLLLATTSSGATLTWSGDGITAGGAGTWNTSLQRWSSTGAAPFNQVWDNAVNNDAVLGGTAGSITIGSAITIRGALTINTTGYSTAAAGSTMTFNSGSSINAASGVSFTLNSPYAGTITKTGTGTVALNNATGNATKFIINAGTLSAAAPSRFGTGTDTSDFITFNGGTLSFNTTTAWTNGKSILVNAGGGTFTSPSASITVTFDKPISGTGNLTNQVMTFQYAVPNTYSGRLFVPSGTTRLATNNVLADAMDMTVNGGTFNLNAFTDTIDSVTVSSGTLTGSGASTLNCGTLTISGGTVSAANVNSSGAITISGGTLSTGIIDADGGVVLSSGTLSAPTVTAPTFTLESGTVSSVLAGPGSASKTTGGTVTLSGASTFSGGLTLSAGSLALNGANVVGTGTLALNGGTLQTGTTTARTVTNAVTIGGNPTFGAVAATTLAGPVTLTDHRTLTVNNTNSVNGSMGETGGSRNLTVNGTGRLQFNNSANSYSGITTINSGATVGLDGDGTIGNGTGAVVLAGGTLLNSSDRGTLVLPNDISITASSTIASISSASVNRFRLGGDLSASAGTLTLRNSGADGATDRFEVGLAGGGINFGQPIVIDNGPTGLTRLDFFNTSSGAEQVFSGVISGSGSIMRAASSGGTGGTTILTAANTFSGGATIHDGTIGLGSDSVELPTPSGPLGTGTITVTGGNGKLYAHGATRTIDNDVVVSSGVAITGANDLTFTGAIDLGNGTRPITVDNTGVTTFAGVISGSAISPFNNIQKLGSGTLVFGGANLYTGDTVVNAGQLIVTNTSGSGTGAGNVNVASAGALGGNGSISGSVTVSGHIMPGRRGSGPGSMTTGSQSWTTGGSYEWEINDVTGSLTPGSNPGWDFLNINGTLSIDSTAAQPFYIDVTSLTTAGSAGAVANFDTAENYSWVIAEASGGIVGFSADKFQAVTTGFANTLNGQFTVVQDGNRIVLVFTTGIPASDPAITEHPEGQTVTALGAVTFDVTATGTGTLTYQWKKDGTNIAGATLSSLVIDPVHVSDAGDYTVLVTGDLGSILSDPATLFVNKANQTISFDPLENKTYGASPFTLNASASSGLAVVYSVSGPASVVGNQLTITGAGSVTVTASQAGNDDYNAALEVQQGFSVQKASLTVTANDTNRLYGASNPTFTASYSGFVNNENPGTAGIVGSPLLGSTATTASGVGEYPITIDVSGLSANNYDFSGADGTLTIQKAPLSLTANNQSRSYGEANPLLTYVYSGFVNSEDESVLGGAPEVSTIATVSSGVGVYSIVPSWNTVSAANYSLGTLTEGTLTINLAPLSLVVDNKSKLQGTTNPVFTGTITGIRNSDNITAEYSTTATESSPVAEYPITGSLTDNGTGALTNYDASITHGILSVSETLVITGHPVDVHVAQGASASFTVTASGGSLEYQWKKDGTNIPGATASTYLIASAQPAHLGSYTVLVSNPHGSLLSTAGVLTMTLDPAAPRLTVLSPKLGQVFTASSALVITGLVSDAVGVVSLEYNLNNTGFVQPNMNFVGVGKPTNWWANRTISAGTNTLVVRALDLAGNVTTSSIKFYYHVPSTFTYSLNTEGVSTGTITSYGSAALGYTTNNAQLFVGRSYKIRSAVGLGTNSVLTNITYTALNESGQLFTNMAALPAITLGFTMKTNLHLQFNYIENPLNLYGGKYYGLISDKTNGVSHKSSGYLTLNVTPRFRYTAKLSIDGNTLQFGGKLPIDGKLIDSIISRTKVEKTNLVWNFEVNLTGDHEVTGSVSNPVEGWVSELEADRLVWHRETNPATQWTNKYTTVLPGFTNKAAGPVGFGYATPTVDNAGKAWWLGAGLGDFEVKGTTFSVSTYLSKDGYWPLFYPLYKVKRELQATNPITKLPRTTIEYRGLVMGWLQLTTNHLGNLRPEGEVSWIKTGWTNQLYAGGFTNLNVPILASRWLAPTQAGQYPLDSTTTNWMVTLSDGDLLLPYTISANLYTNKVSPVRFQVNAPAVALTKGSGKITGSFVHPVTLVRTKYAGVALQDLNYGKGWFMGPGEGGAMSFDPVMP